MIIWFVANSFNPGQIWGYQVSDGRQVMSGAMWNESGISLGCVSSKGQKA